MTLDKLLRGVRSLVLSSALAYSACGGGGDECERDSDCEGDRVCERDPNNGERYCARPSEGEAEGEGEGEGERIPWYEGMCEDYADISGSKEDEIYLQNLCPSCENLTNGRMGRECAQIYCSANSQTDRDTYLQCVEDFGYPSDVMEALAHYCSCYFDRGFDGGEDLFDCQEEYFSQSDIFPVQCLADSNDCNDVHQCVEGSKLDPTNLYCCAINLYGCRDTTPIMSQTLEEARKSCFSACEGGPSGGPFGDPTPAEIEECIQSLECIVVPSDACSGHISCNLCDNKKGYICD